jgi:hypothetical protein
LILPANSVAVFFFEADAAKQFAIFIVESAQDANESLPAFSC